MDPTCTCGHEADEHEGTERSPCAIYGCSCSRYTDDGGT